MDKVILEGTVERQAAEMSIIERYAGMYRRTLENLHADYHAMRRQSLQAQLDNVRVRNEFAETSKISNIEQHLGHLKVVDEEKLLEAELLPFHDREEMGTPYSCTELDCVEEKMIDELRDVPQFVDKKPECGTHYTV